MESAAIVTHRLKGAASCLKLQFVGLELSTLGSFRNAVCFSVQPLYLYVLEVSTSRWSDVGSHPIEVNGITCVDGRRLRL